MDFVSIGQTAFSGLGNGALYAFVALGFGLVFRSTGIINFAQGELMMLGGIFTAVLSTAGFPLIFSVPAACLACAAISGVFYQIAILPADRANMAQLVLITVGLSIFLRGAVTTVWGSDPMAVPAFTKGAALDVLGVSILPQQLWLIATLIVVTSGTAFFFQRTITGLAMRAGAANPLGASFVGIDHRRLGLFAFVGAGFLGGLAGAVWSPIAYAQVDVGFGVGLKGFTAAVFGGLYSPYGPIAGGIAIGIFEAFGSGYVSSAYQDAITFGLLLLSLLIRPQGLLGGSYSAAKEEKLEEVLSSTVRKIGISASDRYAWIAGVIGLVLLGQFLSGNWLTSAIFAGILAIVVMGLVLLTGYGGQLSLGQGAFMMIGAYSTGYLTVHHNWPPFAALAFGVFWAVVIAFPLGRIIFRLRGFYLSMSSLAMLMITLTLARELSDITGGPSGLPGIPPFSILGVRFVSDVQYYYLVLAFSLCVLFLGLSLTRSRYGRALLAIRSNESAARACGVNIVDVKARILALSAGIASVSGSLYVHYISIANPYPFGVEGTISQLTALIAGGFLSLWGTYVGAAITVTLPSLIGWLGGSSSTQSIAGIQYLTFGLMLMCIVIAQSNSRYQRFKISRNSAASSDASVVVEEPLTKA